MSEPISVGDGARVSLIQKLRQIESLKLGGPMPECLGADSYDWFDVISKIAGEAADALEQRWQPIETAPVKPWTPELAIYYRFDCLLQNERGDVGEGWAYYVPPRRGSTTGAKLRWANRIGQCFPILWMPLPPASSEHARSKP